MNELLSHPINKDKSKKLFFLTMVLFCLIPVIINCVALVPLYASLSANVKYQASVLPVIIKYVQDFFDLCAFSVSYALIIFSLLLVSKKRARSVVLIYTIVFLAKIPIKLVMNIFIYGSLGSSTDIIIDIAYMVVYFALEMLQLLAVYIFATTDSEKYMRSVAFINAKNKKRAKAKKDGTQEKLEKPASVLPFSKLVSWYNPLQRSAIKMGILICAIKILSRISNDIAYGAPESLGEVLIMLVYYLSDFIYGIIAYIIALIVFTLVYEKMKAKNNEKTDGDSSPSVLED